MPIQILMPALSPTMEKGNLAKWVKKEGEKVKPGDVIAEIETDKATMEVEAVDEGTIAKILVPEGTQDVPVNQLIAVLAGEGEDPKAVAAGSGTAQPAAPPRSPPETAKTPPVAIAQPASTSERGQQTPAPTTPPPAAERPATNGRGGGRVLATPLARRLARDQGIELGQLSGSGPHGRIIARDVEGARASPTARAAAVGPLAALQRPSDEQIRALFEEGSYDFVPHDGMRKTIAKRLTESKLTIPHYYLTIDVELDALLRAREEINAQAPTSDDGKARFKLSVNDFVIKAFALALIKVPDANVTWTEAGMLKHKHADVGVAVAIDGGLITPIVRHADEKTLSVISQEMRDLGLRARNRKLKPHEYQGGSAAVSNLGMYGIREFAAVINPPHASILAVGMGEPRAVVKDGKVVPATVMTATLSADHRAVDGAVGAELLAAFKGYIEKPISMLA